MNDDVRCPYCCKGQEIKRQDGFGNNECEVFMQECNDCEKIFGFTVEVSLDYYPKRMPCENGEPHDLHDIIGVPRAFLVGKKRCSYCNETIMVDEEANKKAIKEYMDNLNRENLL